MSNRQWITDDPIADAIRKRFVQIANETRIEFAFSLDAGENSSYSVDQLDGETGQRNERTQK